ncbi:MAG: hypothetical protein LBT59_23965 [Clostridiales bacterium]|nr:hypothetical protein [Clostridiales bacterium]
MDKDAIEKKKEAEYIKARDVFDAAHPAESISLFLVIHILTKLPVHGTPIIENFRFTATWNHASERLDFAVWVYKIVYHKTVPEDISAPLINWSSNKQIHPHLLVITACDYRSRIPVCHKSRHQYQRIKNFCAFNAGM